MSWLPFPPRNPDPVAPGWADEAEAVLTEIRGRITAAEDDIGDIETAIADTGWTALSFQGTYIEYGPAYPCASRKIATAVRLKGLVKPESGSFAAGTEVHIGTLPAGRRPSQVIYVSVPVNVLGDSARLSVNTAGEIRVAPRVAATYISLDCAFLTD